MTHNRWIVVMSVLFLGMVASSCASQQDKPAMATHQDFGGQPKDQEARERHHPQYPESAQHLGPQEDQSASNQSTDRSREATDQERAAVSGVGK